MDDTLNRTATPIDSPFSPQNSIPQKNNGPQIKLVPIGNSHFNLQALPCVDQDVIERWCIFEDSQSHSHSGKLSDDGKKFFI